MPRLQNWFNGLNKRQLALVRIMTFIIGIPLILLFGAGLLIIATWLYLEFGKNKNLVNRNVMRESFQQRGDIDYIINFSVWPNRDEPGVADEIKKRTGLTDEQVRIVIDQIPSVKLKFEQYVYGLVRIKRWDSIKNKETGETRNYYSEADLSKMPREYQIWYLDLGGLFPSENKLKFKEDKRCKGISAYYASQKFYVIFEDDNIRDAESYFLLTGARYLFDRIPEQNLFLEIDIRDFGGLKKYELPKTGQGALKDDELEDYVPTNKYRWYSNVRKLFAWNLEWRDFTGRILPNPELSNKDV